MKECAESGCARNWHSGPHAVGERTGAVLADRRSPGSFWLVYARSAMEVHGSRKRLERNRDLMGNVRKSVRPLGLISPRHVRVPGTAIPPGGPPRGVPVARVADGARPDLLRVGIFTLILLSLSRFHNYLGIGQLRPALLLTAACGALALFNPSLINAEKVLRFWPARAILALGVLSCFSAAFGLSLGASAVFILENYVKVIVLAFLIIAGIRHARDLSKFVWAYVASCGILAYYAIFVFQVRFVRGGVARLNSLYTFDSNDIATILMSGLPLTLLVFQTSKGNRKLLAGLILVGIGATMARSGSRGGFLALLAVGALLLVWVPGISFAKRVAFVGTLALALVVAAPPGYWTQMNTLTAPKEDYNWNSHYGRRQLAERGIGYMMRYPLFGVGIGNFSRADGTISEKAVTFVDRVGYANRWRAAHNSYVQVGSEMGIPGLVLWVSLIFGGVASMRRLRRKLPSSWARGDPDQRLVYHLTIYLPVSIAGFAVAAFWVSFAYLDPLYILMALVMGVHISLAEMRRRGVVPMPAAAAGRSSRRVPRPASPAPARTAMIGK